MVGNHVSRAARPTGFVICPWTGREDRVRTMRVRRRAMYATCALPDCGMRFERCRIHHLDPWLPTGRTDLENLVPVCDRHHHQIHDGGWDLSMTPDRVITLRAPDGTIVYTGDTRDRIIIVDPAERRYEPDPDPGVLVEAARVRARALRCAHRNGPDPGHDTTTRPRHGP